MANSQIGHTIGQYRVVAELGRGQHSTVYKAWQQSLQRHVALKVLRRYDEQTYRKFQEEARLTARLIQEGVVNIRQVYEVGQTQDGQLYVAMEYVDDSLQNVLRRAQERNRRINPTAAVELLRPIAVALDAIHSLGWVHLDIKPQNILIFEGGRTMLADFGIAQRRGMKTHACTPAYASPEQAAGDRPVGPWSDIYSLGVVLYEMVAGHPPVRGDQDIVLLNQHLKVTPPSPRRVNPKLTVSQERAIFKALAKSPSQRYRTASELIQAVDHSEGAASSIMEAPSAVFEATMSWTRRMPRPALVGGILILVLAVLALVGWLLWPKLQPPLQTVTETPQPAVATAISPTLSPSAAPTLRPTETHTPAPTERPTATLAPTPTRTPRPTAAPTREPSPMPAGGGSDTPQPTASVSP